MTKATRLAPKAQAPPEVKETPFEALASICSVLVVGLFILTLLSSELRHSVRLDGEHAAYRRSPGRRPDHANAARFVDAANKVSRAEARRYSGVPQARLSAWY